MLAEIAQTNQTEYSVETETLYTEFTAYLMKGEKKKRNNFSQKYKIEAL
ncbi:85_t:CDS:2, partial [Entrophospora sp. SA101]